MSQAITYTIDPAHSTAGFKVRHLMVANVRGEFSKVTGTVVFDASAPENSKVEAHIDATTIHTRDEQRDAHLKSADFLDVEKFPEITFVSKKIAGADGEWKVTGDLTIHGVTKEVTLDVEGPAPEVQRPVGECEDGRIGHDQDQSQGFRPGVERGAGDGRRAGGGRNRHHAGIGTAAQLRRRSANIRCSISSTNTAAVRSKRQLHG